LATLSFDSTEAFAPAVAAFSVTNVDPAQYVDLSTTWYGRGAATGRFNSGDLGGATSGQYAAVPLEQLGTGELSSLDLATFDPPTSGRYVVRYFRAPMDMAIALGSPLSAPTVTFPATGPYVRPRVQLPSQAEYGRMAYVSYQQNYDNVTIAVTSAYLGGTPATWVLEVPDLSAVDGWNDAWGLSSSSGIGWYVMAEGGVDRKLGDVAHDGDVFRTADFGGSNAAASRSRLGTGRPEPHRGGFPHPIRP
jgi:hypothetical protein